MGEVEKKGQESQFVEPVEANVSAGQISQELCEPAPCEDDALPAGHGAQNCEELAPVCSEYVPARHSPHAVLFCKELYVPAPHSEQDVLDVKEEYVPAGQERQNVAPEVA